MLEQLYKDVVAEGFVFAKEEDAEAQLRALEEEGVLVYGHDDKEIGPIWFPVSRPVFVFYYIDGIRALFPKINANSYVILRVVYDPAADKAIDSVVRFDDTGRYQELTAFKPVISDWAEEAP